MDTEEIIEHFVTGIVTGITRYLLDVILKNSDAKEKPKNPTYRQKRRVKTKQK